MYAIIKTGGKQYRVKEGDVIDVELLTSEKSKEVHFQEVVLMNNGNTTKFGAPFVSGATVKGEILEEVKDKKLIIFKYKKRKNCQRTNGHRQRLSRVRITALAVGGK